MISVQPAYAQPGRDQLEAERLAEQEAMREQMGDPRDAPGFSENGFGGAPPRSGFGGGGRALGPSALYFGPLMGVFKGMDIGSLAMTTPNEEVQAGPKLARQARDLYQIGRPLAAKELMFGHMAAEYEDSTSVINSAKYSKALRRPVWTISFGLSIAVRGDQVKDFNAIKEGRRASFASNGRGGPEDFGRQDFGQQFDGPPDGFNPDAEMQAAMAAEFGGGRPGFGGAAANTAAPLNPGATGTMIDESAKPFVQERLGLVETVFSEEFDKRFSGGNFGTLFSDIEPPEGEKVGGRQTEPEPVTITGPLGDLVSEMESDPTPMYQPGLIYLGEMESDESLEIAKSRGLDFIFHIDLSVKENRVTGIDNNSRIRLLHVGSGKSLINTKPLRNRDTLAGRGAADTRVYVTDQMSGMWDWIDRELKLVNLPELSTEVAERRIGQLIASSTDESLRTLAEIRLYESTGAFDAEKSANLMAIAAGNMGLTVVHGPMEEKLNIVHQMATGVFDDSE
ncbi:MAG: hypothetical protein AAF670_21075 [Planctomycetota bacterium]